MKIFTKILIVFVILFTTSFTCFADDGKTSNVGCFADDGKTSNVGFTSPEPETIVISDDIMVSFLTTVIDLNTGVEYHAKSGEPCIIDAEIGHQYSVTTIVSVSPIGESIPTTEHYNLVNSGLTINLSFGSGGGAYVHNYAFNLPEATHLSYVKKTFYSNKPYGNLFNGNSWRKITGKNGIEINLHEDNPINNGFTFEVTDGNSTSNTSEPQALPFSIVAIVLSVIAIIIALRNRRKDC